MGRKLLCPQAAAVSDISHASHKISINLTGFSIVFNHSSDVFIKPKHGKTKSPLAGHSGLVGDSGRGGTEAAGRSMSVTKAAISLGLVLMRSGPLPGRTSSTVVMLALKTMSFNARGVEKKTPNVESINHIRISLIST